MHSTVCRARASDDTIENRARFISIFVNTELSKCYFRSFMCHAMTCAVFLTPRDLKGAVSRIVSKNLESKGDLFTDNKRKLMVKFSSKQLF